MRRPPLAANKYRSATKVERGDYHGENVRRNHAEQLEQVECRIVAWLVCRALGEQWRFELGEYRHGGHKLVHRASGATLSFRREWRNSGRYQITPEDVYNSGQLPKSITVSGERAPADIARDVERRIIWNGLLDANAAKINNARAHRDTETKRRRELLAVAQAYGGTIDASRRWKSQGYPEATYQHFGTVADDDDGYRKYRTAIHAGCDYNGLTVSLNTTDMQLAVLVAETVRNYYA